MTIQDFVLEARNALNAYFYENGIHDIWIEEAEVVKTNDSRMHGLNFRRDDEMMGRSVYIDDLYDRYEEGEPLNSLITEAVMRCESSMELEAPPIPLCLDLDYESIRNRLSVRLLSLKNNISYMSDRPYIDTGCGLALAAVVNCERSVLSEWVISVTNDLLQNEIGCSREELLTAALENTVDMEPPVLVPLSDYIYSSFIANTEPLNYFDDPGSVCCEQQGAFMLTNRSSYYGAAVLFYPGLMKRVAEIFGCGYYVLPSSVHEVILMPDVISPEAAHMKATVMEANATVIEKEDLLSDHVFHYDQESGGLSIVRCDLTGEVREMRGGGRSIA